jgi:hypothetical protein
VSRPFELTAAELASRLDEMVDVTFGDIQSQFIVLPKGPAFVEYREFEDAYERLRIETGAFQRLTPATVAKALAQNALCLCVLRCALGMSPPEWGDLAESETGVTIGQSFVRNLDARCKRERDYLAKIRRGGNTRTTARIDALVRTAIAFVKRGAPGTVPSTVHRLEKVDTLHGLVSLRHVASQHVPYAMLLYERLLGRPFASHRDSVSELVGDVMESAVEDRLSRAGIAYRKTKRAERVPGYDQTPDFFIPDEFNPAVLIEAKITNDDGTARDKATRLVHLAEMRDERVRAGLPGFEVVACIDGRGFGVRRQDMRRILTRTSGKVFTLATLDHLVERTSLRVFAARRAR